MNRIELPFRWVAVQAGATERYVFPGKVTKSMRRTYAGPAIYCWRVEKEGRASCVYVGETEDLCRRVRAFLKPGPELETNRRLKEYLLAEMENGAEVVLETIAFPDFELNGVPLSMDRLGNPHVRKLLESIAILQQAEQGCVILNQGKELAVKKREKFVRSIPKMKATERERLIKIWAAKAGMS